MNLVQYIKLNINNIAQKIVQKQFNNNEINDFAFESCIKDTKYNILFLIEAIDYKSEILFIDYIKWLSALFQNIKLPVQCLKDNLKSIKDILFYELKYSFNDNDLSEYYELINKYINLGLDVLENKNLNLSLCVLNTLNSNMPYYNEAKNYLNALLDGDKYKAYDIIKECISKNINFYVIYNCIIIPVQHEIGKLWYENKISVACEHFCTALNQTIIAKLYNEILQNKKLKNQNIKIVSACALNELHELGIRMITDALEIEGYQTYYLGANMPVKDLGDYVYTVKPELLALSATMLFNVGYIKEIISIIKNDKKYNHIKILVGGYPFLVDKNLYKIINADFCSHSIDETIAIINKVFN